MDARTLVKLCKDCKFLDAKFQVLDVDLIFKHVVPKNGRTLDFDHFQMAMKSIAEKKGMSEEEVLQVVANHDHPILQGTEGQSTLHDHHRVTIGEEVIKAYTLEEHHDWAQRLFQRLDRQHEGALTLKDFFSLEFYSVLHGLLAPENQEAIPTYGQAHMSYDGAVKWCFALADVAGNGKINLEDFKNLLLRLRARMHDPSDATKFIFCMFEFDFDGGNFIHANEFYEIYRFFMAHIGAADEFHEVWAALDTDSLGKITQKQLSDWLQEGADPKFRLRAPAIVDGPSPADVEALPLLPTKSWFATYGL